MPFAVKSSKNGVTYFLHSRRSATGEGRSTLYFFARAIKPDNETEALEALPAGYIVIENAMTGLPLLKRAGNPRR